MQKIQKYFNSVLPFLVIFILGTVLVSPLLTPGFFPIHDNTQVARVHQMAQALSDGMFPVRWVPDLGYGYGYPIFNFYAPLAYYVGAFFVLLGFNALTAAKIMIAIPIFILGSGTYLLGKTFWGRLGGLISSVLAMTAPYIALLIYVRGAISEYYALSFIPLVFLGLFGIYQNEKFRYVLLTALSLTGVMLSHNLTSLIVLPFVLLALSALVFSSQKSKKPKVLALTFALLLGVLLSAFYWLPALAEMRYTNVASQIGGGADFRDHFVCPYQLWESQWGFGGSAEGCLDGLSFRIGKLHLVLAAFSLPLVFLVKKKKQVSALVFGFGVFALSVFMTLSQSRFLWESINQLAFIQYPWRFLGVGSLALSFIVGSIVLYANIFKFKNLPPRYLRIFLGVIVLAGSLAVYLKLFQPQFIEPKTSRDYTDINIIRFETSKISDEYLPEGFIKPETRTADEVAEDQGLSLSIVSSKTQEKVLRVETDRVKKVVLNIAYFPSWAVFIDGEKVDLDINSKKLSFSVPPGIHEIKAIFENTKTQNVANIMSFVGVCIAVIGIIISHRKKVL